jgi:hypothetical protein
LDQLIAQPWVEAATHSADSVAAVRREWIAHVELPASAVVISVVAAADSAAVVVAAVAAVVDDVRAATQWRMK